jgi:hypothetical protein
LNVILWQRLLGRTFSAVRENAWDGVKREARENERRGRRALEQGGMQTSVMPLPQRCGQEISRIMMPPTRFTRESGYRVEALGEPHFQSGSQKRGGGIF